MKGYKNYEIMTIFHVEFLFLFLFVIYFFQCRLLIDSFCSCFCTYLRMFECMCVCGGERVLSSSYMNATVKKHKVQWNPVCGWNDFRFSEIQIRIASLANLRSTHWATGARRFRPILFFIYGEYLRIILLHILSKTHVLPLIKTASARWVSWRSEHI